MTEGDRKERKTGDVLSFVVSDICWGNNHPPMEYSGGVTVQGPLLAIFTLLYAMEALEQAGNYLPCTKTSLSKASIGRSKTDFFDNVMLSVSVSEAVALFGRYLRFNLVEQSDNNNNSTLNVNDQSPSMQSKRSAFEVLMTSSRKTSLPEP